MNPVSFHESEVELAAPQGSEGIDPLRVLPMQYADGSLVYVSCWQISWLDWLKMALSGRRVFIGVLGRSHPPIKAVTKLEDM